MSEIFLGDRAVRQPFAEMLGGYGEEVRDPAQIAPALRRARESVQKLQPLRGGEHLGRPSRNMRAGTRESDDVQVEGQPAVFDRGGYGGKRTRRSSHPRFHARAVRADVHAAARLVRGGRHQGREGRERRCDPRAAPRHSGRRQPVFHHVEPQQALNYARYQERARQESARTAGQALRRAGRGISRPGRSIAWGSAGSGFRR